jgi:uncharacterized protein involved in outer membrane biogenesis
MKKIIIGIVVTLVVLVVVALAVVFFSLNSIVKKGVETVGPQMTKVEVRLGSADISPFSGSGSLNQLFVGNPDGYKTPFAIQMGSIKVGVKIGSVFSDTVVVDEINIQDPEITLEGTLDGNNLNTILNNLRGSGPAPEKQPAAPAAAASEKPSKKFIVKDIVLSGAKVHVNVSGFGKSVAQTVTIPDLHLQNVGNADGGATPAQLAMQILQPVLNEAIVVATDELKKQGVQQLQNEVNKELQKQNNPELNKAAQGVLTNLFK